MRPSPLSLKTNSPWRPSHARLMVCHRQPQTASYNNNPPTRHIDRFRRFGACWNDRDRRALHVSPIAYYHSIRFLRSRQHGVRSSQRYLIKYYLFSHLTARDLLLIHISLIIHLGGCLYLTDNIIGYHVITTSSQRPDFIAIFIRQNNYNNNTLYLQFTAWVDAVIFVFSLENEASFNAVYGYYTKMAHYRNSAEIPLILVGTQGEYSHL